MIGGLNAERLYTSQAFFVKMISMLAALIFTFGVVNNIAKADGKVSLTSMILGGIAIAVLGGGARPTVPPVVRERGSG